MSKDLELFKFARLYLGQTNWENLRKTTQSELALFQKFPLNIRQSYIVYGNANLLNKFKAFYLTRCLKTKPLYMQCFINEYAEELSSATKDETGLNVDQDLVFLYAHAHSISSLGRSETWLSETVLNKISNRNRDGLVTIILSEVRMSSLEDKSELKIINLAGKALKESVKEILNTSTTSNSNNNGMVY
jgi:hypothetical protein